ncbi:MAG: hypothetical protein LC790_13205, partial [Actinobacteria bacterium]|nr:hypothetical protein [Actinomycetota bacterium]
HGQPNPADAKLTLAATTSPIVYGGSSALSGKLNGSQAGGKQVVIEANPAPYAGYKPLATVTTTANGSYAMTVKPLVNTRYRATAKTSPPTASGEVAVRVRMRAGLLLSDSTPRKGSRVVFSGRVFPAHDGARVLIRKRTSTGSYVTIARTTLRDDGSSRSRYRRAVTIRRSGVYQVRVTTNDTDHLSGISKARRITVH